MKTVEIEKTQKILSDYVHCCDILNSLENSRASKPHSTDSFQIFTNLGDKATLLDNEVLLDVLDFLVGKFKEKRTLLKLQIEQI